jgi:hypothetical protein
VAKINTNDYQAPPTAFVQNFGVQTINHIVIMDLSNIKQGKDEIVQKLFTESVTSPTTAT